MSLYFITSTGGIAPPLYPVKKWSETYPLVHTPYKVPLIRSGYGVGTEQLRPGPSTRHHSVPSKGVSSTKRQIGIPLIFV